MSLDVYLRMRGAIKGKTSGIFIRDGGQTVEISREDWDRRFPDREPVVVTIDEADPDGEVYSANITHNLNRMADEAGIYQALWRPDEIGVAKASQLIPLLTEGLAKLRIDPAKFEALNPTNGWGSYSGFVPWVERYLRACEEYPDADVSIWR